MKIIGFKTFINEMIIPPKAVHDVNANKRFYPELLKGLRKRKLNNLIKKKLDKIKKIKKIEESIKKTKNSFGIIQGNNVKKAKPNKGVSPPIKTVLDHPLNLSFNKLKNKIKRKK